MVRVRSSSGVSTRPSPPVRSPPPYPPPPPPTTPTAYHLLDPPSPSSFSDDRPTRHEERHLRRAIEESLRGQKDDAGSGVGVEKTPSRPKSKLLLVRQNIAKRQEKTSSAIHKVIGNKKARKYGPVKKEARQTPASCPPRTRSTSGSSSGKENRDGNGPLLSLMPGTPSEIAVATPPSGGRKRKAAPSTIKKKVDKVEKFGAQKKLTQANRIRTKSSTRDTLSSIPAPATPTESAAATLINSSTPSETAVVTPTETAVATPPRIAAASASNRKNKRKSAVPTKQTASKKKPRTSKSQIRTRSSSEISSKEANQDLETIERDASPVRNLLIVPSAKSSDALPPKKRRRYRHKIWNGCQFISELESQLEENADKKVTDDPEPEELPQPQERSASNQKSCERKKLQKNAPRERSVAASDLESHIFSTPRPQRQTRKRSSSSISLWDHLQPEKKAEFVYGRQRYRSGPAVLPGGEIVKFPNTPARIEVETPKSGVVDIKKSAGQKSRKGYKKKILNKHVAKENKSPKLENENFVDENAPLQTSKKPKPSAKAKKSKAKPAVNRVVAEKKMQTRASVRSASEAIKMKVAKKQSAKSVAKKKSAKKMEEPKLRKCNRPLTSEKPPTPTTPISRRLRSLRANSSHVQQEETVKIIATIPETPSLFVTDEIMIDALDENTPKLPDQNEKPLEAVQENAKKASNKDVSKIGQTSKPLKSILKRTNEKVAQNEKEEEEEEEELPKPPGYVLVYCNPPEDPKLQCPFCEMEFQRRFNFESHVKGHLMDKKSGSGGGGKAENDKMVVEAMVHRPDEDTTSMESAIEQIDGDFGKDGEEVVYLSETVILKKIRENPDKQPKESSVKKEDSDDLFDWEDQVQDEMLGRPFDWSGDPSSRPSSSFSGQGDNIFKAAGAGIVTLNLPESDEESSEGKGQNIEDPYEFWHTDYDKCVSVEEEEKDSDSLSIFDEEDEDEEEDFLSQFSFSSEYDDEVEEEEGPAYNVTLADILDLEGTFSWPRSSNSSRMSMDPNRQKTPLFQCGVCDKTVKGTEIFKRHLCQKHLFNKVPPSRVRNVDIQKFRVKHFSEYF